MKKRIIICEDVMCVEGSFNLNIRDNELDFEDINSKLNLQPTKIKRKGDPITSKRAMKDDYWSYKVEFGESELDMALESFLNDLKPSIDEIRRLATKHDVYIFFSLRSNLGQMGFELEPAILKALADLNIRFEVHILSYGEVEDG